ncbi:MAG: response regulator [Gemmatimonadota bacterium]
MGNSLRVVVIEDDPDLRSLIKLTLEFTASWDVTTAEDGASGIETVRAIKPNVVVVDLMMPGMDGYEVCRRLKAEPETAAIPLVMLTARTTLDDGQLEELDVAGVVFKPFDPDKLAERVRELAGVQDG